VQQLQQQQHTVSAHEVPEKPLTNMQRIWAKMQIPLHRGWIRSKLPKKQQQQQQQQPHSHMAHFILRLLLLLLGTPAAATDT
jgi:hypothetical protein